MNKKQKSPSCLCCKGTCDCEYACSHPHTEESCCTYPLEHKGCEQIKEAYYKGRNQTLDEVKQAIYSLDWIKIMDCAIKGRKTSWNDNPIREWRNASDEVLMAFMNAMRDKGYFPFIEIKNLKVGDK